jgi:ABC-type lipoprotein export system ATPase subunit
LFLLPQTPLRYIQKSRQQLTKQQVNDSLLDCSDAHSFSNDADKDRIGNCFTWIKADPTFDGLKHAIEEFEERIFVGEEPPLFEKVAKNRTKYISALNIRALPNYSDSQNVWFDNIHIPLNHKLVAIIGNKGSGKSAIADVISLCANYHDDSDFSFLTSKKFKEKKGKLAKNFEAHLTWESGVVSSKGLNDLPDEKAHREVKYLPQGLFEKLTNEISTAENFQREIESVVFSHINEADKLDTTSFSALVDLKTNSVAEKIQNLKDEMRKLNKNIILHEHKATDSYKFDLENSLAKKKEELKALAKPEGVENPSEDPKNKQIHEQVNLKLDALRKVIKKIEDEIKETIELKKNALIKKNKLEEAKSSLIQKKSEIETYIRELKQQLLDVDIEVDKLFTYEIRTKVLDDEISNVSLELKQLAELLEGNDSNPDKYSLHKKLELKNIELKNEKGKLDKEQQEYQAYLTALSDWEKDKKMLIGDSKTPNTITYFESNIEYVAEPLKLDLERLRKERQDLLEQIFDSKQEVVNVYKTARKKLNEIISDNADTLQNYRIEVDASLTLTSDFQDVFLTHILQNKAGSFHSKDGAEKQFNQLISGVEFDEFDGVTIFLDAVLNSFNVDLRSGQNVAKRVVVEQVRDIHGLYDYLFGLEFLTFNYQLKQGGKEIDQLSPGERGALLLVFYLLLDKNNIPLIIDQPEDNLDNHSVATILVPFIKAAKKKRQIIMVTHNPNLAVVSDAEQVIYVSLDKKNNYQFSAQSGSIENKTINEKIVEVLEGAMPAFNTRKRKYYEQT